MMVPVEMMGWVEQCLSLLVIEVGSSRNWRYLAIGIDLWAKKSQRWGWWLLPWRRLVDVSTCWLLLGLAIEEYVPIDVY
jgi:hypothetical protein